MTLKQQIDADLKDALLSGNKATVTTLRGLKSVILDVEIAEGKRDQGLSDDEVVKVLVKQVKQRKESIELYEKAGASDKANAEKAEIATIEKYLPEQMSQDDIAKLVDEVVAAAADAGPQQIGQIIGQVKARAGAAADGGTIARLVKERLAR